MSPTDYLRLIGEDDLKLTLEDGNELAYRQRRGAAFAPALLNIRGRRRAAEGNGRNLAVYCLRQHIDSFPVQLVPLGDGGSIVAATREQEQEILEHGIDAPDGSTVAISKCTIVL